jgi:hypothetical protein
MPAFAIDHHAKGVSQGSVFIDASMDRCENTPLFLLSLGIKLVEPLRNLSRTLRVFDAEKLDHIASHIHAAGGVNAGRDAKSNFAGS